MTPEEHKTPPVVARANQFASDFAVLAARQLTGLYALYADLQFRAIHVACLPRRPGRRNGNISPDWALADAKLSDAETIAEAISWLNPKERMAILQDPSLIARMAALPQDPPRPEAVASAG
jgi:membrane glycosyltransferase